MRRIAEAVLSLAVLALVAMLAMPWKARELPRAVSTSLSVSDEEHAAAPTAATPVAPDGVIRLFVGRPAAKAEVRAAPARPPQDATWLRYLGRSRSADGMASVFLKDTKTGRLITATQAGTSDGWSIAEEQDGAVIVKYADTLYSVRTR
jgi:hypothetical protein